MHNVVPFPKAASRHAGETAHHFRRAILLLDLSLQHTRALIEDCPRSDNRHKLEHQLREARMLLEMLRASAETMFPNIERHYD
ncbi:hypothetical protein [Bradyrhizobium niftali]|jgi:hypothetical protein|uniref:Uncharacterized protein n=1 Tax=Bradyrhizobium niftali TaxID=2560055 RepID=A0A4Y9M812_9BRAD|nr:hypothetical protein [Bradyrhizobium niftali]TFV51364.1 hypothetical protein E4K65_04675 [Bradyrhizobium niftali]